MDDLPCVNVKCCDLEVCIGSAKVIRNVTFDCLPGEWIVLTGASGAGNSTLLRAINGLCPPSTGNVWALGSWIPGRPRREAQRVWRGTGTVLQELALFEPRSAQANVELRMRAVGHDRDRSRRDAQEWLERFGLGEKVGGYPANVFSGERHRVALARAIAPRPQLLLLDEPTSHLDDGSARVVMHAIKELVHQGATVVMSSHREEEAAPLRTCRITLVEGMVTSVCR